MNKRGQLTVQSMLIGIIVIVLVAAIIFFFIKAFPFIETVDKESCHQSVVLRSQAIAGIQPGKVLAPLNCKTQDIKIDSGNEQFINREIANSMYDCWWMLGEGKLDFFGGESFRDVQITWDEGLHTAKANCIICSTIKFDEAAKNKNLDTVSYIAETKIPSKDITYLEYFTQPGTKLPTDVSVNKIDTNQDYAIVFMNIKGGSYWNALKVWGGGMLAGGITGFKIGSLGGPKGMLLGTAIGAGTGNYIGQLNAIKEFGNAKMAASRCDGSYEGCSNLMLIPLNAQSLTTACNNIESIP